MATITQIRKTSDSISTKVRRIYDILRDVSDDELSELIGEVESLQEALDEDLERLEERSTRTQLTERQERRKDQYETLSEPVENILSILEQLREGIDDLETQCNSFDQAIPSKEDNE